MELTVARLRVYPVKSCEGVEVEQATLGPWGFRLDREFAIIDDNAKALSQKSLPPLATVGVRMEGATVQVGVEDQWFSLADETSRSVEVAVHSKWLRGTRLDAPEAERALSNHLGQPVRVVRLEEPIPTSREVDGAINHRGFVDAYPVSILSRSSLEQVRAHAESARFERFRINILFDGCAAFEEDAAGTLRCGGLALHPVKPIDRCSMVGVDQASGARDLTPLTVLSKLRPSPSGPPCFGHYRNHAGTGVIRVGDVFTAA